MALNGSGGGTGKMTEERHPLSLRFKNRALDGRFQAHYNSFVQRKVRVTALEAIGAELALQLFLVSSNIPEGTRTNYLYARLLLLTSMVGVLLASRHTAFQPRTQRVTSLLYICRGLLLVIVALVGTQRDERSAYASEFRSPEWEVATLDLIFFVAICFFYSGMRFYAAAYAALSSVVAMISAVFLHSVSVGRPLKDAASMLAIVAPFTAACMVSARENALRVQNEYLMRRSIEDEKEKADIVVHRMMPSKIAEQLRAGVPISSIKAELFDDVTVMFCYITDFERLVVETDAEVLLTVLHEIWSTFDALIDAVPATDKIEAGGDTYIAVAGCPLPFDRHTEALALYSLALLDMAKMHKAFMTPQGTKVNIKIGLNSGPVVGGIIGHKTHMYKLFGDTMNTSSRMCSYSKAGHINCSARVASALGSAGFAVESRGMIEVKGKGKMEASWLKGLGRANKTGLVADQLGSDILVYGGAEMHGPEAARDMDVVAAGLGAPSPARATASTPEKSAQEEAVGIPAPHSSPTAPRRSRGSPGAYAASLNGPPSESKPRPRANFASSSVSASVTSSVRVTQEDTAESGHGRSRRHVRMSLDGVGATSVRRLQPSWSRRSSVGGSSPTQSERFRVPLVESARTGLTDDGRGVLRPVVTRTAPTEHHGAASVALSKPGSGADSATQVNSMFGSLSSASAFGSMRKSMEDLEAGSRTAGADVEHSVAAPQEEVVLNLYSLTFSGQPILEHEFLSVLAASKGRSIAATALISIAAVLQAVLIATTYGVSTSSAGGLVFVFGALPTAVLLYAMALRASSRPGVYHVASCICAIAVTVLWTSTLHVQIHGKTDELLSRANMIVRAANQSMHISGDVLREAADAMDLYIALGPIETPLGFLRPVPALVSVALVTFLLRAQFRFIAIALGPLICAGAGYVVFTPVAVDQQVVFVAYTVTAITLFVRARYLSERGMRITYFLRGALSREQQRHKNILLNTFPPDVAYKLLRGATVHMDVLRSASFVFADIKGFTPLSASMSPTRLCEMMNVIYSSFDEAATEFSVHKLDTIGDCYVVAAGFSGTASQHALATVNFALRMLEKLDVLKSRYPVLRIVQLRIGVHTGSAVGGVVGTMKARYLVWGADVLLANKMESSGVPGRVKISHDIRSRLGPHEDLYRYEPHGKPVGLEGGSRSVRAYLVRHAGDTRDGERDTVSEESKDGETDALLQPVKHVAAMRASVETPQESGFRSGTTGTVNVAPSESSASGLLQESVIGNEDGGKHDDEEVDSDGEGEARGARALQTDAEAREALALKNGELPNYMQGPDVPSGDDLDMALGALVDVRGSGNGAGDGEDDDDDDDDGQEGGDEGDEEKKD